MPTKFLRVQKAILMTLLVAFSFLAILQVTPVHSKNRVSAQPEAMRVLVVANRNSPVSLRVAQYYMQRRSIPANHLLVLDLPDSSLSLESIAYATYQRQVEKPLREFLRQRQWVDQTRYVVLTRGVPLRVKDVPYPMPGGETFVQNQSVDSTIAAMDYKLSPTPFKDSVNKASSGKDTYGLLTPNLYWRQTTPFEHRLSGGYMVTRLDGYSEADARVLVDRAMTPRPRLAGAVLIDPFGGNETSGEPQVIDIFAPETCTPQVMPHCTPQPRAMAEIYGPDWSFHIDNDLRLTAQLMAKTWTQLSTTIAPPHTFATGKNLMGYVSWGSNDEAFQATPYHNLRFRPGAIAETIVSTGARTFFPTAKGQSLIGDLVAAPAGVTGIRGYVDEPENMGIGSSTVLLSNYFQGANLATAYYRSIRFVGWRDIVLGDPLATAVVDY